jgi:2-polyprenyl-6-methoxyphenol hydroxylase-like FAD-dependent oxidoreductase
MVEDKIMLAGDAAHSYTPAGGFGMNSGFQDIHQIAHTLHTISRNPKADYSQLLSQYNH